MRISFSETGCIPYCPVSRTLGQGNQHTLTEMGTAYCPGPYEPVDDGTFFCAIPGRTLDNLWREHPGIPAPMLYDAVLGVMAGHLNYEDIPPRSEYSPEAVQRWGAVMVKLDEIQYPGEHYDIAEIPIE